MPPPQDEILGVVDEAMASTATVFAEMGEVLTAKETPTRQQLLKWKKLVGKSNKATARAVRTFWSREDRHLIEKKLLHVSAVQDRLDKEANYARVLERLRQHATVGTVEIDRAVGAAVQVQAVLAQLAPVPSTAFHGATFLTLDYQTNEDSLQYLTQSDAPSTSVGLCNVATS
jgi:hypothetical protein